VITLIWAQANNGVIGAQGHMPWKIPEEMHHFTTYTVNKPVLMGRKTWEGLYVHPLPHRKNIVLSSTPIGDYPDVTVTTDLDGALNPYLGPKTPELVVIGGGSVFKAVLGVADQLVISYIKGEFSGDTYAPKWPENDFELVSEQDFPKFTVKTYKRRIFLK